MTQFPSDGSDADQNQLDEAWRTELRRRIDDIENGKVVLVDLDESHAQLRAELAARRATQSDGSAKPEL